MGKVNVPICPREISPELKRIWELQDELMQAHRKYREKVLVDAQRHKKIIAAEGIRKQNVVGDKRVVAGWKKRLMGG